MGHDERGTGIGPGEVFLPNVTELAEAMRGAGWATEDPHLHLLPHLEESCAEAGSAFRLVSARSEGEIFVVELEWTGERPGAAALRAAAMSLLGRIAEDSTHVRQRRGDSFTDFEMATGTLPPKTAFEPHGHLVRLRITHAAE